MRMRAALSWLVILAPLAAGCGNPSVPRERLTLAVLAGVYYSASPGAQVEAAMVENSEALLKKTIADLGAMKDLDFAIVGGDLLARADPLSLDRAKALLAELKVPYYVILGEHDGPAPLSQGAAGDSGLAVGVSRGSIIWAFQGRGFSTAEGYWAHEVLPGLVVVGLDTVMPGGRGGHVSAQQLAWLDQTLKTYASKSVIVAGHHSLVPLHPLDEGAAWAHMVVDNGAAVREVIERHRNVMMVLSAHHHFAEGRVSGRSLYLAAPSVSVWPLAFQLIRLTPKEAGPMWVPLGDDDLARRAQERLLASKEYRGVFPAGEDGDTACVRLFGVKKTEVYPLPAIRP
jgi:3',5'-cyclic AMP phosphodiesterase CpdA